VNSALSKVLGALSTEEKESVLSGAWMGIDTDGVGEASEPSWQNDTTKAKIVKELQG
jgi:hypothetical protein